MSPLPRRRLRRPSARRSRRPWPREGEAVAELERLEGAGDDVLEQRATLDVQLGGRVGDDLEAPLGARVVREHARRVGRGGGETGLGALVHEPEAAVHAVCVDGFGVDSADHEELEVRMPGGVPALALAPEGPGAHRRVRALARVLGGAPVLAGDAHRRDHHGAQNGRPVCVVEEAEDLGLRCRRELGGHASSSVPDPGKAGVRGKREGGRSHGLPPILSLPGPTWGLARRPPRHAVRACGACRSPWRARSSRRAPPSAARATRRSR